MEEINRTLVDMRNIDKQFGRVKALSKVSVHVDYGEILGLVGDNGAGKSTLIKILTGVHQPDGGEIYFEEKRVKFSSAKESRECGIEAVYQDLGLVNVMNTFRNFFLGKEITKDSVGSLDMRQMKKLCTDHLQNVGIELKSTEGPVLNLSGGERQAIAIARSLYFGVKLLILDEPTAALSIREAERVLKLVKDVKQRGISVVFITHNIYHVYSVADRFTILEKGEKLGDVYKKDVDEEQIMRTISTGKPQWDDSSSMVPEGPLRE